MIATQYFVYIHTSRHAGTFLNALIGNLVPEAKLIQYHGHLLNLPDVYKHLPVIGFVRNPWDWYVSLYFNYRKKGQYLFQVISEGGRLGFEETIARYLLLGDGSALSQKLLTQMANLAPNEIILGQVPPVRFSTPGLTSGHIANYPSGVGYYTWLFQLMYKTTGSPVVHVGRFENLREEMLRLFALTDTPVTPEILRYLEKTQPCNTSEREKSYQCYYSSGLKDLVAEKDKYIIDTFGYKFD